ncbi:MAG: endolytic transglycosylase MltG [Candidatus Polarisedimenticolaceae bacterium]|nr:endolytic transglycosylase MltG [Candidatus Polarisedimenticolaceae bacterium]
MIYRILAILLLAVSALIVWQWTAYEKFKSSPLALPADGLIFNLEPGTSMRGLAFELEQREIISNALYFRSMARLSGQAARIQAGEFLIPAQITPSKLLALFVSGKVTQYSLTLVEGWTFREVMKAVAEEASLTATLGGLSDEVIMRQLGFPDQHPEGRFFPDTYHFPKGTTDLAFLKRAYSAMSRRLASEWEKREKNLPYKSAYEALIMASIVERESGLADERPMVAGVFVRRLQKRMRLQTDPTVIYGMGERFDGNIRRRDLKEPTPYNTYVIKGLPPTPISMPSVESINAALHPAKGDALYFVATGNTDGSSKFSATLDEHNRAVRAYLRYMKRHNR